MNILKTFFNVSSLCIAALGFYACEEVENENPSTDYATIIGNETSGYRFLLDSGIEANFSGYYDNESLKGIRRMYIYYSYFDKDCKKVGGKTYVTGKLQKAWRIDVDSIISREEAMMKNLLVADSTAKFDLGSLWCCNGFMNIELTTEGTTKTPDLSVYYDPEELGGNRLLLHLNVNRHGEASSSETTDCFGCFDLQPLAKYYTGKDSISFELQTTSETIKGKMATKAMTTPTE